MRVGREVGFFVWCVLFCFDFVPFPVQNNELYVYRLKSQIPTWQIWLHGAINIIALLHDKSRFLVWGVCIYIWRRTLAILLSFSFLCIIWRLGSGKNLGSVGLPPIPGGGGGTQVSTARGAAGGGGGSNPDPVSNRSARKKYTLLQYTLLKTFICIPCCNIAHFGYIPCPIVVLQ